MEDSKFPLLGVQVSSSHLSQSGVATNKVIKKMVIIITMKKEDEEVEKVGKNWVDGEVLHLIALRREMEFEFTKNAKKR